MKTNTCLMAMALVMVTSGVVIAAPITYNFTGTVTQLGFPSMSGGTSVGVNVGDDIPISITVNDPGTGGPNYFDEGLQPVPLYTSALFNGINYTSVLNYINIKIGSSINFFTTVPHSDYGFDLLLNGAKTGVLPSGVLPTSLSPGDFTGGTFQVSQSFYNNLGYSGTIDGIGGVNTVPVPEPASLLLVSACVLGIAGQSAWRRRDIQAL